MPIRINLLAEAHALEDMRRRDPVKRTIWVGAILVLLMLAYSTKLQLNTMLRRAEVSRIEGQISTRTNEFKQVMSNQRALADCELRLKSLNQLACSRLLYGTLLSGLQQATVEDVQLVRCRAEQNYAFIEAVKPKTNTDNRISLGRPATVTERILLTLEGRDFAPNPGDQVNRFKQAVAEAPYFQNTLGKTNEVRLTSLTPPNPGGPGGKAFVMFTVECRFPEKTR